MLKPMMMNAVVLSLACALVVPSQAQVAPSTEQTQRYSGLLAAAGADLNAFEYQRYDPVTIAAVANDEETLALLLQLGASAKNVTSPYEGTALIAAAHLGHVGVVRQLIAAGAPLDQVNRLHWTALLKP